MTVIVDEPLRYHRRAMPFDTAETRATQVGKWLFAAVIPCSALALGSVPTGALVVMSIAAAVACVLLWLEPDVPISTASRSVVAAIVVLTCYTALQALPLPATVSALAPASADIWARALSPLHEAGPTLHPLSVAPGATQVEVLRGCFYGCVFLGALRITSHENGERFLTRLVIVSALAMALSALGHAAVGAERVFGVYRPREVHAYAPNHYAPLLNTNHLSAYLDLGAIVALGALLSKRNIPRALSGTAVLVCAGLSVWQGSRGATGALVFGVLLTFALTLYTQRRHHGPRASVFVLAACAIAATLLLGVTYSEASRHLLDTDTQKGEVARRSLSLVASAPWLGFGRGSFESVFASVRPGVDFVTWTNPEDIVIQWLVEWGIPFTIAGFAMLCWALRPRVLLQAVRPAIGPWVAVVASALHDTVDYHLEVPGIVALVAVCVALAASGRPPKRDPMRPAARRSTRSVAFGLAGAAFLACLWCWSDIGRSLAETRQALAAEATDRSVSAATFAVDIRAAMLRFPAEPFFPLMGAVRVQTVDGGSVIPWIARALERNPRFGRAHLILARALAPRGAAQARLEYRLAYEYDASLRPTIEREVQPLVGDANDALEVVPDGPDGAAVLDRLVGGVAPRLPSTSVILDEELERRMPASLGPLRRRVQAAVTDFTNDAPWCDGRRCADDALAAARELAKREPAKCEAYVLVARVRIKEGEVVAALEDLERAASQVTDHAHCVQELVLLANESGQGQRADAALDQLVRLGCGAEAECLELYGWAATIEEQRGHYARAARLYRRILDLNPEREDALEHIGLLGERPGMLTAALEAYRTLAMRHPDDPKYTARSTELRARAQTPLAPVDAAP